MDGLEVVVLVAGLLMIVMVGLSGLAVVALFEMEPIFTGIILMALIVPTILTIRSNRKVKSDYDKILKMRQK